MPAWLVLVLAVVVWCVVSLPVGVVIGKGIHRADVEQEQAAYEPTEAWL